MGEKRLENLRTFQAQAGAELPSSVLLGTCLRFDSSVFSPVIQECEGCVSSSPCGFAVRERMGTGFGAHSLYKRQVSKSSKYHRLHCTPDNSAAGDNTGLQAQTLVTWAEAAGKKFSRVKGYKSVSPSSTSQGKHM